MIRLRSFLSMFLLLLTSPAQSADLTAEQVRGVLAAASRDKPANLSGRSLENLDLSNFDFKGANLSGANLFGAKLDSAELSGANLSGARLDLAWIMRANFTNADLSKASLLGLVVSSGLEISLAEAPTFKGANFSGARLIARLSRFDLSGADFSKAKMGADMKNQSMGLMRTDLSGANLSGANFFECRSRALTDALCQSERSHPERRHLVGGRSVRRRPDRRRCDRSRSQRRHINQCSGPRHDERIGSSPAPAKTIGRYGEAAFCSALAHAPSRASSATGVSHA
jgi:uncharacterized protein YjbI with pentapeptide repeats